MPNIVECFLGKDKEGRNLERTRKEFFRVIHELICNYLWEFNKNHIEHAQE